MEHLASAAKTPERRRIPFNGGDFVWVALAEPDEARMANVAVEFSLPALAIEDALSAHQRPKLEVYGDIVFAVLKPVTYVDSTELVDVDEWALFIGPTFVVTVTHGARELMREVQTTLDQAPADVNRHGPMAVLHRAADIVVDEYENVLELISEDIDDIETQVFSSTQDSAHHSERIYKLKREIAEFRRAVAPLVNAMQRLANGGVPAVDDELALYFRDVHDHVLRSSEAIESADRLLSDVLQAEVARVSAQQNAITLRQNEIAMRQNEDMRKISAWAALGLVPTAIAGIYGMNFDNMPELHTKYGYFVVLAAIFSICVLLYATFRRRDWL